MNGRLESSNRQPSLHDIHVSSILPVLSLEAHKTIGHPKLEYFKAALSSFFVFVGGISKEIQGWAPSSKLSFSYLMLEVSAASCKIIISVQCCTELSLHLLTITSDSTNRFSMLISLRCRGCILPFSQP